MSSSYRKTLDDWLAQLDVRATDLLDLGGSQLPAKGRTRSWDVKNYKIADLEEPHVGSPKPDLILDLNEDSPPSLHEEFDMILCLEVFDYIWNPGEAFINLEHLLTTGGTIWATFPFVYPTHNPIEDDSLRYTEFGIQKLANYAGLKILQIIKRRPETDAINELWRAERMRAVKHYDHNVTGWIVEFTK